MLPKVFVSAVCFIIVIAILASTVLNPSSGQKLQTSYSSEFVTSKKTTHLYSADELKLKERVLNAEQKQVYCFFVGEFCHTDPNKITEKDQSKSIAGLAASAALYPLMNMPASAVKSIPQTLARSGIVPDAQAAGFGDQVISPFRDIWLQVRNVSYLLIVVVILIEAFALMFRSQANSKDSITIETYLPKIIVTMIMVQLSFAFAGALIDIMYLVSMSIFLILSPLMNIKIPYSTFLSDYLFGTPIDLAQMMFRGLLGSGTGSINDWAVWKIFFTIPKDLIFMFGRVIGLLTMGIVDMYLLNMLVSVGGVTVIAWLATSAPYLLVLFGVGAPLLGPYIILGLLLFVAVLYVFWRVFMVMVKSYFMILLLTIFSPVFMILDLLPNSSFGVKKWVKSFVSELVVFPVTFLLVFTLFVFHAAQDKISVGAGLSLPFMVKINSGFIFIVGIIAVSLLPRIIENVRNAIDRSLFPDLDKEVRENFRGAQSWVKTGAKGAGSVRDRYMGTRDSLSTRWATTPPDMTRRHNRILKRVFRIP